MTAPPISERHLPHFHRRAPMKEAVRAATTASITISTALNNGDSLDGITLATGDRVLVKDQSTDSQNGIYVVGASPARDYDESTDDPSFGYLVFVREGTANGGTLWKNTNTSAPTVGSTSVTFSQFSSGSSLTIKDEGSSLATAATSIDFVGGGVTASGTGAAKTVTIPGGGSGTVHTAKDASTTVTDPDTIKITGTGGIGVTVSESPSGTAAFVVDGSGITTGGGGSATDAITGQIGAGGAIIPGLQGSPDIRVAGANDDEFDTTDTSDPMTGWTTLGSPTHDINSTQKSAYFVTSSAGSVALQGIYKACPTIPFTMTAKLNGWTITQDAAERAGIFVAEAAPGKIASAAMQSSNFLVTVWTNRTTFVSNPASIPVGYATIYLQVVVTSSTNVAYNISQDGKQFSTILSGHNPLFTIGSVGLMINPVGSSIYALFDWVRFT